MELFLAKPVALYHFTAAMYGRTLSTKLLPLGPPQTRARSNSTTFSEVEVWLHLPYCDEFWNDLNVALSVLLQQGDGEELRENKRRNEVGFGMG